MSTHLAMQPVAEALYALLSADSTLVGLTPGGIHGDLPQDPTYECLWFELQDERDLRGFGTGSLPEIILRVHAYSLYGGKAKAQAVLARVIALLKDAALVVDGWVQCGLIFYDDSVAIGDEELNGVKVHELAANFRIYVEGV